MLHVLVDQKLDRFEWPFETDSWHKDKYNLYLLDANKQYRITCNNVCIKRSPVWSGQTYLL